jgi:hypothetical protein
MLAAILILAGCAPRATAVDQAASTDPSQIVIDLPAIVLDVQRDGSVAIGEGPLSALDPVLGPRLAALSFPPALVDSLTAGNIQHIQIDNTAEGLVILVNGKAVPSLAWDGERLVSAASALSAIGPGIAVLDKVLPLITNMGLGVILRMPVAEGEESIPFVAEDDGSAAASLRAQEEFLATVGTPPTFQFTINFNADGTWSLGQLDQSALGPLASTLSPILNSLASYAATASALGIGDLGIATNTDGVFLSINGQDLPYLAWDEGKAGNLIKLAADAGLLEGVLPGQDVSSIVGMIEGLLPAIQASNVSVQLNFP